MIENFITTLNTSKYFSGIMMLLLNVGGKHISKELSFLQDSFLIIFNKINQFKHNGSFEGWLKRIVINTAITKYRESKRLYFNEEILLNEPYSENLTIETSEIGLDFLLSSIQKLPNRYRLIFNLYVLDNYSHKDIAKMLNISEGTSKSNLSRARKILKKQIENYSKPIENK